MSDSLAPVHGSSKGAKGKQKDRQTDSKFSLCLPTFVIIMLQTNKRTFVQSDKKPKPLLSTLKTSVQRCYPLVPRRSPRMAPAVRKTTMRFLPPLREGRPNAVGDTDEYLRRSILRSGCGGVGE